MPESLPESTTPARAKASSVLVIAVVALLALAALAYFADGIPLNRAGDAWRAGRDAEAIAIASRWSDLPLRQTQYAQLLAAAQLTSGNDAAAKGYLDRLSGHAVGDGVVSKAEVGRRLFAHERYAAFLAYDAAVHETPPSDDGALYRAASQLALGHLDDAEATFGAIDRTHADAAKLAALQLAIEQRKQGSYPYVFDREGHPIGSYQLATNDVAAIDAGYAPLLEKRAGALTIGAHVADLGANETIETTLDPFVQKAAIDALSGYRGSLVAIDPRTNEILAIVSNAGHGPMANLALESQYEPGSVVKILTGLNTVMSGIDLKTVFPYDCKGQLTIDGKHFGDWVAAGHGVLPSIDEALAVSCNITFGDLGTRLGAGRLRPFMTAAGFDGAVDLGLFRVPLGRTVGTVATSYDAAFYAIGLEHETSNALHLAMIASLMANDGVLTSPRLLRGRHSILGEVTAGPAPQTSSRLASHEAVQIMTRAMKAVVTYPQGTGRRAAVDGVTIAMKTGTAGQHAQGLQSIIVAMAPADSPKIAFAMIAEGAGPAEFAGAKIAHDFVQRMKPRL